MGFSCSAVKEKERGTWVGQFGGFERFWEDLRGKERNPDGHLRLLKMGWIGLLEKLGVLFRWFLFCLGFMGFWASKLGRAELKSMTRANRI